MTRSHRQWRWGLCLIAVMLGAITAVAPARAAMPFHQPSLKTHVPQQVEEARVRRKFRRAYRKRIHRPRDVGRDEVRDKRDRVRDKIDTIKKKPAVIARRKIERPSGICIGGRVLKRRCQCGRGETRRVVGKSIFACQPNQVAARFAPDGVAPKRVPIRLEAQPLKRRLATLTRRDRLRGRGRPGERFAAKEVVIALSLREAARLEERIALSYRVQVLQRTDLPLLDRRVLRLRIADGRSIDDVLAEMRGDTGIATPQPNNYYRRQAAGQGASGLQYAFDQLEIPAAHRVATGRGLIVAVIDSGIDRSHPDLDKSIRKMFDATGDKRALDDPHGTSVAGIIAAHGQINGVAPESQLLDVRVFGSDDVATTMTLLKGLQWAADNRARIVNLSLAGPRDELLEQAIEALLAKGIVVVAAAGNEGAAAPSAYPAAFEGVIAVTATDATDGLYAEANQGSYIAVAAPGVDVIAPALNQAYLMNSGTSFAAAHVSGVIALMLQHDPGLSVRQIRELLQAKAKDLGPPGIDAQFGAGRVNALAVLQ
jgi:hypothetical protein